MEGGNGIFTHVSSESFSKPHGKNGLARRDTLDQQSGVVVRAPWLNLEATGLDLLTPAVVPAHPAALTLALIFEPLQQIAPLRFAAVTLLQPVSEAGREAMDELHQQTSDATSIL